MKFRSWFVRAWCRMTGAYPVWIKDDAGRIRIKVARYAFDPFLDQQDLVIRLSTPDNRGYYRLDPNGTISANYGKKWKWKHVRTDMHVESVLRR